MISDEELMERVQRDHTESFELLVDRYQLRLCKFIFRYTRNYQDAEDLAQETFLRVYRCRKAYRRIAKFSTWLYTIALNLTKSHHRKHSKVVVISINSKEDKDRELPELFDSKTQPDEFTDLNMLKGRVEQAIELLPRDYRQVILMREIYELSYEEISNITGLPMGTVKSRISRGRSRLQHMLHHHKPGRFVSV